MDLDNLIDQFIEEIDFEVLIAWADTLDVEHDEYTWHKSVWIDKENELRIEVADAMIRVGEKK